jgi:outer membrane protein TolC
MKRFCSSFFVFLFFLIPLARAEAPTNTLSPDTVVQRALAYHPALKGRNEELHMATARRLQADAGLKPRLDARAQAQHFEGLENSPVAPGGLTLPVVEDQYTASIGITQPLYTGGRVSQQRKSARYQEAATYQTTLATAADLTLQTLTVYWQWSKALAQIDAFQAAVVRTKTQLADTRNLKQAGLATDNDLLANEVLLDQIQLQLQSARQQAELSQIRLTQLTGEKPASGQTPMTPDALSNVQNPTLEDALGIALSNRPELASLRMNSQASAALIEVARAEARPQLALVARYEQGSPNPHDFPPEDTWKDDAFIGAALTWNLFDGGLTRARTAEARAKAAHDDYETRALCETIIAETRAAFLSAEYTLAQRNTSKHAEMSATRNLQVATDLWKNGTARHSDVLDAQAKLTGATAQRIAAEADVLIAEAGLHHAIHWPP